MALKDKKFKGNLKKEDFRHEFLILLINEYFFLIYLHKLFINILVLKLI